MKTTRAEGLTYSESEGGRELVYADEFKRLIHDNPGAISSFLKFDDMAKGKGRQIEDGEIFEEGSLKLTVVNKTEQSGDDFYRLAFYYKAEIGDESFFVKSVPGHFKHPDESGGVEEVDSLQEAKRILAGVPGVNVVDYQLGYEDKKEHTYFVSKWVEGTIILDYMKQGNPINRDELLERTDYIYELLKASHKDVRLKNMMYNPVTDTITIYDVHLLDKRKK